MNRLVSSVAASAMAGTLMLSGPALAVPGVHVASSPSAASSESDTPDTDSSVGPHNPRAKKYRRVAQRAVNNARADNERVRVQKDACLRKAARSYVRRTADFGGMVQHDLEAVAKRCDMAVVKEAVGIGFTSGRKLIEALMTVKSTRKVLLRKKARHGVVEAVKRDGVWYAVVLHGDD